MSDSGATNGAVRIGCINVKIDNKGAIGHIKIINNGVGSAVSHHR